MTDTSRPRTIAPTTVTAVRGADLGALVQDALPLLLDWLPRQRWFAGKGRPITAVSPATVTLLPGAHPGEPLLLHLLLNVEQRSPDGTAGADVYQLLLGARSSAASDLPAAAVIGRISGGPHDGMLTYDAAHDPVLALRLLRFLTNEHSLSDEHSLTNEHGPDSGTPQDTRLGPLRFRSLLGAELSDLTAPGTSARVGTAEQSNTSVVYGDTAILKLFRRINPGLNPDLELSLALSQVGSNRIPATLAWYEGDLPGAPDQPATLGLLQRFLHGGKDGWEFALAHVRRLRTDPEWQGTHEGHPSDHISGNFSAESFLLGRATAEVHLALARTLPVGILERPEIEALADAMALRLDAAVLVVPALAPYRAPLRRVFQALAASARDGRLLRSQRIHGDLHLGQSMRTARGWVLLDFEGEPAKTLEERRRPQPAVRDVAAMLRSFDYAAAHLLTEVDRDDPGRPALASLAAVWALRNRAAFCAGYAAAGADDPAADPVLLHAMETDKAVYEVVYEARNRPEWLGIPMSAIIRLAEAAGR